MKRSEMIDIVRSAVSDWLGCGCTITEGIYILDKIEKEGMLPPAYETGNWVGLSTGWEKEESNEWEPEDD